MAGTCPDGHLSQSEDYCDVCGLVLEAGAGSGSGSGEAEAGASVDPDATSPDLVRVDPTTQDCPNCSAQNPPDALFCEACGYDYTTGTLPRPVEPLQFPAPPALPISMTGPPSPMPSEAVTDAGDPGAGADAGPGAAGAVSSLDLPSETDPPSAVADPQPATADPASTGEPVPTGEPPAPASPPAIAHPPSAAERATFDANPAPALGEPWVAEVWIDPDWYADQGSSDRMPSPGMPTVVLLRHTSSLVGRASRSRGIHPEVDVSGDPGVSRRHAQLTSDGTRWFIEDLGSANGTYVGAAAQSLPEDPVPSGQKREIAPGEQVYLGAWTRIVIRKAAEGEF